MRLIWKREWREPDQGAIEFERIVALEHRVILRRGAEVMWLSVTPGENPADPIARRHLYIFVVSEVFAIVEDAVLNIPAPTPPFKVAAFALDTGRRIWERELPQPPAALPVVSGGHLLLPARDGTVTSFRTADGGSKWLNRFLNGQGKNRGTKPGLFVQVTDGVGVAQLGADTLVGFALADGKLLWTHHARTPSDSQNWSEGFAAGFGIAYARLGQGEVI